ncbi:DUF6531 domain-containing protein [Pelotomaculum terephthalicicum JT]|uniref:DUF7948 domain-containing protein n=1 Tax=Pelotomaculum TaxID=191373 RepID=UPI0009CCF490|nr:MULTISPECIES: SBBP repeat-containing protein [Pelotomaculum]MCG9968493.1 DUF6531 domain-containing protein [Pelotomaculum terephthalicicum JT]OPX88917.1 MAG: tRNA nuclease WapA precursor [Pelotomaculum sp. PtaB.Bin117]
MELRVNGKNVEKVFTVRPGAEVNLIKLRLEGANSLNVNDKGELEVGTGLGVVSFTSPIAYQDKGGKREYVKVTYHIEENTYGFTVGNYDKKVPLVIDPLLATTFLGVCDTISSIKLDDAGNIYVAGSTCSDFPVTAGAYDTNYTYGVDGFVAKFDASLSNLMVATYIGSNLGDYIASLAIDDGGNIYIAGTITYDGYPYELPITFPITTGAYDTTYHYGESGISDSFISKLDPSLSTLLASTLIGGCTDDEITALAIDHEGNVYVAGYTGYDYPTTAGAFDTSPNGDWGGDGFVSKLDSNLTSLLSSTLIGGSDTSDNITDIAIDGTGNICIAGHKGSTDYPTTGGAYDTSYNLYGDCFISRFDSGLHNLLASTFIGGNNSERSADVSIDGAGNVYLAGSTSSTDYPTTTGAYDTSCNGGFFYGDSFVSKLDAQLDTLLASTFIGGSSQECTTSFEIDDKGNVYVAGFTGSADFPTTEGAYDTTFNGLEDGFISKLDTNLRTLLASTLIGGSSYDNLNSLAIDNIENVYVGGDTLSADYPVTSGAYDTTFNGITNCSGSACISKLSFIETSTISEDAQSYYQTYEPGQRQQSLVLEPIDAATGAHMVQEVLTRVDGAIPITFNLNYNSLMLAKGPLGKGWGHNYETWLDPQQDDSVKLHWTANRCNTFNPAGNNQYTSSDQACRVDLLVKNTDGSYDLTRKDQSVYRFNTSGKLTQILNGHGQSINLSYDGSNRLQTISEPLSGRSLNLTYNTGSLIAGITDSLSQQITLTYDSSHNLTGITYPDNKTTSFTYDADNRIQSETDGEGKQVFYDIYDAQGRVVQQKDGLDQTSTLQYDALSQPEKLITTIIGRNGQSKQYIHNLKYELEQVIDELGNTTAYTYDNDGNRTSVTDAAGYTSIMTYDSRGNLLTITDPANHTTTITYDNKNNLTSITNADNKTTTYTYDTNNNLTSTTDALNHTTNYSYDTNGLLTGKTAPRGGQTTYTYENGMLKTVTDPAGITLTYTYDNAGRVTAVTNAANKTSTITYNARNNIIQTRNPLNHTTSFTYDSNGKLLTKTDARGNTTTYAYDANLNLTNIIDALGNTTRYQYDPEGRITGITDARGNTTTVAYDAKGRQISITDPLGNTSRIEYDAVDNITGKYDALNKKIATISYDILHNPLTISDALDNSTTNQYDNLSRLISSTNPLNQNTQFVYDDLGRLTQTTDPMNATASQQFDSDGNRTTLLDPSNNTLSFTYDLADRLTSVSSPTGSQQYAYNILGYLAGCTNGRNQTSTCQYDDAGRLTSRTDPDGTISYTYDNNGNILTVIDASGAITRVYDTLNRITGYTDNRGNNIQYAYDQVGNLTRLTYPDGKQVNYTYDPTNRLTSVTDWANRTTTYNYDPNGRLTQTNRPDGSIETRRYDDSGRITQLKDIDRNNAVINQYDWVYDAGGNITTEYSQNIQQDFNLSNVTITYTTDNRLATYNGDAVNYDADGNMTTGPLQGTMQSFTYDSCNRLTVVGSTYNTYDAENQRIASTIGGQQTRYVINPNTALSQVLVKTDPNGINTYYVYGLGLIGEESGDTYKSYHYDLRGSTVALSNISGTITDKFQYGPYGELQRISGNSSTPFLYNGRDGVITDANGLYYMRARYYNPEIMRFMNRDVLIGSVEDTLSLNRYAYVQGNPVLSVDPLGLCENRGSSIGTSILNGTQLALDVAGLIPGVGEAADAANALIYTARGDYPNATLSAGSMIPFVGWAGTTGKFINKTDAVIDVARGAGKAGKTIVYTSRNADDVAQYVGITDDVARRAAEQLRIKGINIEPLMSGLSRSDARAVEQALIETHVLQKNGGTLMNKINSIATSNPSYAQQLERGYELLKSIGYVE